MVSGLLRPSAHLSYTAESCWGVPSPNPALRPKGRFFLCLAIRPGTALSIQN